jgi:hypothetical protein
MFRMMGPTSWSSKQQTDIAQSSTENEYMALNTAKKETIWLVALAKSSHLTLASIDGVMNAIVADLVKVAKYVSACTSD